ncbi:hypothetical protein [Methylocaldum sp.]|uniref:hypothetical protein n=1 Tax=Methylocaldum sp. TaxID=1969727 RepID=UPI002D4CD4B2|nr:hypothetical protein [Methylocaldum sp.]HYE35158.1 hypothetical protein [Methylocaldum sp.]
MKRYSLLLVLLVALSACLAPPIKPPADKSGGLHTILVIPVEPPPLEVMPDLIESRLPIYRQNDTVPFDLFLEKKIYRNPGGVLIAGLVSHDDIVPVAAPPRTTAAPENVFGLEPAASLAESWTPTLVLAREAAALLTAGGLNAISAEHYYRLPIAPRNRTANLAYWHGAIRQWYNADTSPVDYRSHGSERVDAVLEVGIGTYKIFESQTPLQVLVKLIDPATGQVIGRTGADASPIAGAAPTLLDHEAEKFKKFVSDLGAKLVHRGLTDLELPASRQARSDERSIETASMAIANSRHE